MKTYYFVRPKVFINFVDNTNLDQKTMSMVAEDDENDFRIVIPFNENSVPFFKEVIEKFEKWIEKGVRPEMAKKKEVDEEENKASYIG